MMKIRGALFDKDGTLIDFDRTWQPIAERLVLQIADGDEVIIKGYCERDGFRRIGFGECRGIITPARPI